MVTPKKTMQQICDKTCINMTTLYRSNFKKNGHNTPWDNPSGINIYWKYLDDLTKKHEARDIATSGDEKVIIAVT